MKRNLERNELFQTSHMMILISYTIFSVVLMSESLIMSWEKWALVPITLALLFSWMLHIRQSLTDNVRIWTYSLLMMCTFFFYGIHQTSTYDLAPVMTAVIMLYTMTGMKSLILLCQVTYFITMGYGLISMYAMGMEFDSLVVTRTMLHVAMVIMVGWISRVIIEKWGQVLLKSKEEIHELTDATNRLNDFLANVSHEIRTPINAVIGLTGVCIEKEEREEIRRDMEAVNEAGKKVGQQISDILDYSEIDRKRLARNDEDYMLSSLLNDLVMQLRPYKKPGVELIIDVDPAIPSVLNSDASKLKKILWHLISNGLKYTKEGGVYVRIYPVEQSYGINLCIEVTDTGIGMDDEEKERVSEGFYQANSGRARSSAGLGLGMAIVAGFTASLGGFYSIDSKEGTGTTVRVSVPQKVVDDAGNMSIRNRDKICIGGYLHFDKFKEPRVRDYYNRMVGNIVRGLGVTMHRVDNLDNLRKLADSVNLTHLFVGEEEYKSGSDVIEELARDMLISVVADAGFEPVEGSRVSVIEKPFYCFPVVGFLNRSIDDKEDSEKKMMLQDVRALVVDDEPMNLTVAKGVFTRYGMVVETAASGPESLEMIRENDYDIVFMDHMMPGMDGVEAMKLMRADKTRDRRDMPIVALTANAVSTAREMFMKEGFDGFVSKPIELVELERVLKNVLPASCITYVDADAEAPKKPSGNKEIPKTDQPAADTVLDTETGLHYCQNDEDFYHELLQQYLDESSEKKNGMKKYFEEKDFENYKILVHALKSTSKMIGATALSEKAKIMEDLAKQGGAKITSFMHDDLMGNYEKILSDIRNLVSGRSQDEPSDDDEILEFAPEESDADVGNGDDEILEFLPEED
ncbi:MAG: response regulator [Lachnospiraceae bacterium]|nr:response regulator [Lachnospiraceae bacterium]